MVCPLHRKQHKKGRADAMSLGDAPGPKMTAFHNMMLSGHGLPEMPPGGSLESRLKSRIRRLLQLVDYNQTSCKRKIHGRDKQNGLTMTVVTNEEGVWAKANPQRLFSLVPPPAIGQPCITWSQFGTSFFSCFTRKHPVSLPVSLSQGLRLFSPRR